MHKGVLKVVLGCIVCGLLAQPALSWEPSTGDWLDTSETSVRVMTWNLHSNLTVGCDKSESMNAWSAIARIIASMKPDVLMIQEMGDSDTVSQCETLLDQLIHGGSGVGAYVQKYDASYDLPYIYVSTNTDGYNRNAILSRYPFADLNGDRKSTLPDIAYVISDEYAPGGNGGIRGFAFCEIDLPDDVFMGDLVTGTAHLKAYSGSSEHLQRINAAKNVAYYIDYLYGGAGTGTPDPHNMIYDSPAPTSILDEHTPVIVSGDWNEDELTNNTKGPAEWLTMAEYAGGTDGTDRDRSDMTYDDAREPRENTRNTYRSNSSKLDYIAWQDSIATEIRSFIFDSGPLSGSTWFPPELIGFGFGPQYATSYTSDHRPVIVDLELPPAGAELSLPGCLTGPNVSFTDPNCVLYDFDGDLDVDLFDYSFGQRFLTY